MPSTGNTWALISRRPLNLKHVYIFIESTTCIQYSRLSSDIERPAAKLLRHCITLPGWFGNKFFTMAHPNVSKERTKNAQFIVISLRNHMPLVVSNWWFPDIISCRKTVCPIPVSLDTVECRWRHANNSGHTCFVHLCSITDPTSGRRWLILEASGDLCRSTSALFYTLGMATSWDGN